MHGAAMQPTITQEPQSRPFSEALKKFLDRCDAYCEARGISRARLSTLLFNHGGRLAQLHERGNGGTATLDEASQKLAALESALEQAPCE